MLLDRERCIQCGRCTRFAEEIAGDPLIDFVDRGDRMQVLNFAEQPFDSYFSGNTVQICPVGALTARQYRFKARPWDLETVETSCNACAVQCRGALQSSSNRLVRLLGVDSEPVNHGWLCDKGRYGIEWIHSDNRVLEPHRRVDGELREVSWPEALDAAAELIRGALGRARARVDRAARRRARHQRRCLRVGAADEGRDRHRQRRRAARRRACRPSSCSAFRAPRSPIAIAPPRSCCSVRISKRSCRYCTCAMRRAAVELGVPLVDLAAVAHGLSEYATVSRRGRCRASELGAAALDQINRARGDRPGPVVVVLGRPSMAESAAVAMRAGEGVARRPRCSLPLGAAPRQRARRDRRGSRARVPPGSGHARRRPRVVRRGVGRHGCRRAKGLDAHGILEAAAAGQDRSAGDPRFRSGRRLPRRRSRAPRRSRASRSIIAVGGFLTGTSRGSEVVLPPTLAGEKTGTITNLEGPRAAASTARSRPRAARWTTGASRSSSRSGSAPTSTSRPSTRSPTRWRASRPRSRASPPRCWRGRVTAWCCRCAITTTRSCCAPAPLSILAEDGSGTSWDPIKVEGEVAADDELADEELAAEELADEAPDRAPALYEWDGQRPARRSSRARRVRCCASWSGGGSTTTDGS